MEITLAERLLLLMLDDDSGRDRGGTASEAGLAGALLLDLTACGALTEQDGDLVVVDTAAPPRSQLLAAALETVAASGRRRDAKGWVRRLPRELKPLRGRIAQALVERGVLDEQRRRVLGIFPTTRYPELDRAPEAALRADLREVLLGARPAAGDEGALIGLLGPFDLVKGLVPKEHRKEASARAKEIGAAGATGEAVENAVQAAVLAATMAAVTAATTASVAATS